MGRWEQMIDSEWVKIEALLNENNFKDVEVVPTPSGAKFTKISGIKIDTRIHGNIKPKLSNKEFRVQ